MKTLLFLLIIPFLAISQTEKWEYCTVNFIQGGFDSKSIVYVDYGTEVLSTQKRKNALVDSLGHADLKSLAAGFNILGEQGWELVSSYVVIDIAGKQQPQFVFKRRKRHN